MTFVDVRCLGVVFLKNVFMGFERVGSCGDGRGGRILSVLEALGTTDEEEEEEEEDAVEGGR